MNALPVMLDLRTARLTKVAQALQLDGALPTASAKRLVGLARAVRLYAEAQEYDAVRTTLGSIIEMGDEGESERAGLAELLRRHAEHVRKALT